MRLPITRWRRWLVVAGAFVLGGAATLATAAAIDGGSVQDTAAEEAIELTTATVERRDLTTYVEYDGTLAAGKALSVAAAGAGVVTETAPPGAELVAGDVLARIDNQPVVVIYGTTPAYRDLDTGSDPGPDVRELEAFLVTAGFGSMTVDDEFTDGTADAVGSWQEATGQDVTGTVAATDLAVVPGPVTVSEIAGVGETARAGSALATLVPTATATTEVAEDGTVSQPLTPVPLTVEVEVPVADLDGVGKDTAVRVELASGTVVDGVVTAVASTVTAAPEDQQQTQQQPETETEPTVAVTATIDAVDEVVIAGPVTVGVPGEVVTDAVAVPTRALVALAEGGQAVEVVGDNGAAELVAVEPGLYADGWVELVDSSLEPGTTVVVPA